MKISLCMIVKNEAAFLAGCLDSVRDAVDEIIVLDTGSTDRTPDIARTYGAQVFPFIWCDDFSAARNESIARATGDWVLYVDADERLAAGGGREIRRAVAQDDFDCGFLTIHNASRADAAAAEVLNGSARLDDPVLQRRLLRRTPDLHFTGLVHEHLDQWLAAAERRVSIVPAALIHLGYAQPVVKDRAKLARNLELLQRQIEQDPFDFAMYGYLAHTYLLAGQPDQAWEAAARGWALIRRGGLLDHSSVVRLAAVRTQLQLARGDPEGAIETLALGVKVQGESPDFDFLLGEAQFALARRSPPAEHDRYLSLADRAYQAALAKQNWLSSARYIAGAAGYRALCARGQVALQRGRFQEAVESFRASAEGAPEWAEPWIGRARALIALSDEEALFALLKELNGHPAEALITALVAEQLGLLDVFSDLLQKARQQQSETVPSLAAWQEIYTRYQRLAAYRGQPGSGDGITGAVCGLLAGVPAAGGPRVLGEVDKVELTQLVTNLLRFGHPELIERLCTDEAEVALPGVPALVDGTLRDVLHEDRPSAAAAARARTAVSVSGDSLIPGE